MEYVYSLLARDIYSQVAVVEIASMSHYLSVHMSISKNLFANLIIKNKSAKVLTRDLTKI